MRRPAPASRPSGRYAVGLRPSLDPDAYLDAPTAGRRRPNNSQHHHLTGPAPSGMTRREDPLSESPYAVLGVSPVDRLPVENIVGRSVHHRDCSVQLALPFPRFGNISTQAHPVPVSALSGSATCLIRPVIRGGRRRSRPRSPRFPAAFRPPAFASGTVLRPLGSWAFFTVGLPRCPWTPSGLSRCA